MVRSPSARPLAACAGIDTCYPGAVVILIEPMHEMSLCESVLAILHQYAEREAFSRVKTVYLEIGALAGIEPDAMRFSFDVIKQNTLADQAHLEIIKAPGKAYCPQCSKTVDVYRRFDQCPDCGSYQLRITAGEEMRIKELEVE